jgi:uncharacterized alpha-E superfamily protein
VVLGTQTFTGMLEGIVNDGAAQSFMELGRNLERADMTSRIVDVRAVSLMPDIGPVLRPFANIQWMSVLRSLSGYHMYRLKMRERVHPMGVVRFLLADEDFPRACACCLQRMEAVLQDLPNSETLVRRVARVRGALSGALAREMSSEELHGFIDRLQLALARINDGVAGTYFSNELPLGERRAPREAAFERSTQSQSQGSRTG